MDEQIRIIDTALSVTESNWSKVWVRETSVSQGRDTQRSQDAVPNVGVRTMDSWQEYVHTWNCCPSCIHYARTRPKLLRASVAAVQCVFEVYQVGVSDEFSARWANPPSPSHTGKVFSSIIICPPESWWCRVCPSWLNGVSVRHSCRHSGSRVSYTNPELEWPGQVV